MRACDSPSKHDGYGGKAGCLEVSDRARLFACAYRVNLIAEDGAGTVVRDAGRVIPSHEGFLVAEMHADESGTSTGTPAT